MQASFRARTATAVAALLLSGLLAGCDEQEDPATVVATLVESSPSRASSPVGSAAAKGAELSAVVTVRAWISARNRAVRTGDSSVVDGLTGRGCGACAEYLRGGRWSVDAARVTRHVVRSAWLAVHVTTATRPEERVALEFQVSRVAGTSVVTKIVRVP